MTLKDSEGSSISLFLLSLAALQARIRAAVVSDGRHLGKAEDHFGTRGGIIDALVASRVGQW